ncbi:MAG: hypothetical protein JKY71_00120 [Alphaproteobacteria bacterium]|nr:hypothetical protein [Alphaproteobacteria bacterium]
MEPRQDISHIPQGIDPALLQPRGNDTADPVPVDYSCATIVDSLTALSNTKFSEGRSAVVMPRQLEGDFNGLARQMSRDVARGLLKGAKFHNSWLLIDDVRSYAESSEAFKPELKSILGDMEHLQGIGRSPMLKVYTYDYDDDTVDEPHVDPYTPNYETGQEFPDRYISVFNSKVTRHASHEDVASEYTPFGTNITTYRLKPGTQARRFNNGDIWRQACGIHPSAKGFIHWSGTEMGDTAKLILTA